MKITNDELNAIRRDLCFEGMAYVPSESLDEVLSRIRIALNVSFTGDGRYAALTMVRHIDEMGS